MLVVYCVIIVHSYTTSRTRDINNTALIGNILVELAPVATVRFFLAVDEPSSLVFAGLTGF